MAIIEDCNTSIDFQINLFCFMSSFYLNDIHPKSTFIPRHGLIISDESL